MERPDWQCPNVNRCELFAQLRSEARLRKFLDVYCLDAFERCARYCYAKQHRVKPPRELLPTGEQLGAKEAG